MAKIIPALIMFLVLAFLVSGCIKAEQSTEQTPSNICIQACEDALNSGKDLSAGPCLLDPMPENPDWVCDVAHSPRQSIDNLAENQCQAWRNKTANHFVEVTPGCKLIRSV